MEVEKIKVTCQGKIYDVTKKENSYSLTFPDRDSIKSSISTTEDGELIFMETDSERPDSYFWVKYRKDGYIEYANNTMSTPMVSKGVYDPNNSEMGTIDEPARNLYFISKQIEGYEKIGISPIEVLELRYSMMGMALKMLGYESVTQVLNGSPNPDVSVIDLNRAVEFIEQYPAFAQYVTKGRFSRFATVDVTVPENFDKEKFKKEYDAVRQMLGKEEEIYASRAEFFDNVRHPMIKPDFALGMKNKMSSSNWKSYSDMVKKLGKLVVSFNADLLAPAEKMQIIQATAIDKMELEYKVFLITQVPEMDEALAAESYYFIDEVDSLDKKIEEDLSDDRTRNSTPGKLMKQFVDELKVEAEDRRKGIERRDFYRNVYPYDKNRKKVGPNGGAKEDPRFDD